MCIFITFPSIVSNKRLNNIPLKHPFPISLSPPNRKSFPSGHTSLTFTSLTYLTLYLLTLPPPPTALKKLTPIILTTLTSFWIASSRIVDHWHHPSDVVAGAFIGAGMGGGGWWGFREGGRREKEEGSEGEREELIKK